MMSSIQEMFLKHKSHPLGTELGTKTQSTLTSVEPEERIQVLFLEEQGTAALPLRQLFLHAPMAACLS